MIQHCKDLKSMHVGGGEIRRQLVTVVGQPVVLLNKSHPILQPCFTPDRWKAFANRGALSETLREEVDLLNRGLRFSYNCHVVSIGGLLGMKPDAWLEGSHGTATLLNNPTQDLLDAHFRQLGTVADWRDLPALQHDDVLVFRDASSGDLVHSGRVRIADGQPLLLSKLGEHPAAITVIEAVAQEYTGQFDQIDLYQLTTTSS